MEQLIQELHHPANQASPDRVNEVQKQIQRLQRDRTGWQLGIDLLQHHEALVRFYGALTLTIKINADWDNDGVGKDDQMRQYLIDALVTSYIRLSALPDANFVLQKLCSTLVTLFAKPDSGWDYPLRQILAAMSSGQYLPQDIPSSMQTLLETNALNFTSLKATVLMTSTMAEDLASHVLVPADEGLWSQKMKANTIDAWQMLRFCMVAVSGSLLSHRTAPQADLFVALNHGEVITFIKLLIQAMPFWASTMKLNSAEKETKSLLEELARECVGTAAEFLGVDNLTGAVLQLMISLQQQSRSLIRKAVPGFPNTIATSPTAKELTSILVSGDFSQDALLYVDFLESVIDSVDTSTSAYLHTEHYQEILQALQQLLRCEGVAGVEDPVCQIVLERINQIIEGFMDWDEDDAAKSFLHGFAANACEACLQKIKLPLEQMSVETQDWDSDERAKFQDFRYDVQDFLQSAFTILGNSLIEEIAKTLLQDNSPPDWSTFEAGIFALAAFSDTMSHDPDMYDQILTAVFRSHGWAYIFRASADVPDKARQSCIKFISEHVVYLQRHSDDLISVLNFLFSSLHLQTSMSAASRAIYSLCDFHRGILTEALPQFLGALSNAGDVGDAERHRLYAAVAAVIQALPHEEDKIAPLDQLLSSLHPRLSELLHAQEPSPEDRLAQCLDLMATLSSIGKGLRAPSDNPVDLEKSIESEQVSFWTNGPGSGLQHEVLRIYHATFQAAGNEADSIFIETCCDFIKAGFPEVHPSPFKFADTTGLELVKQQITLENPNIDSTMACATGFLASIETGSRELALASLTHPISSFQHQVLLHYREAGVIEDGTFVSSSLDFLGRVVSKWGEAWFRSPVAQEAVSIAVELSLIVMADTDTLPRRSAASFFSALAETSGSPKLVHGADGRDGDGVIESVLRTHGPRILALLLRLLGGECARSELESLTDTFKRFWRKQWELSRSVYEEVIKEENGMMSENALSATTLEQRKRFIAQCEKLRGARKTNDIVKDFWVTCKGSGFGYIA